MTAEGFSGPWPAPAKLNLFLHVTGRRADGLHELQTVFQFLDYVDQLWFSVTDRPGVCLEGGVAGIPQQQDLIVRAARRLIQASGFAGGASIRVVKRIPSGGGLGGGSSDAATTLVALNSLWRLGFDLDELAALGLELGADVPVFVRGLASWAEGVGDQLTPIEGLQERWCVVVDPAVSVSTAEIFSDPELTRNARRIKIPDFVSGVCVNQLEPVVIRRYPQVGEALNWLTDFGQARMSGSGACVYICFKARQAAESVLQQLPPHWNGFVARTCNRSPLFEKLTELCT